MALPKTVQRTVDMLKADTPVKKARYVVAIEAMVGVAVIFGMFALLVAVAWVTIENTQKDRYRVEPAPVAAPVVVVPPVKHECGKSKANYYGAQVCLISSIKAKTLLENPEIPAWIEAKHKQEICLLSIKMTDTKVLNNYEVELEFADGELVFCYYDDRTKQVSLIIPIQQQTQGAPNAKR